MVVLDPDHVASGVVAQHNVRKALVGRLVCSPLKLWQTASASQVSSNKGTILST